MQEFFEVPEAFHDFFGRGWNEGRIGQSTTFRSPVLGGADGARSLMLASHTSHELLMDFPNQSDRDGERLETLKAVIHGGDAVQDLAHISWCPGARHM